MSDTSSPTQRPAASSNKLGTAQAPASSAEPKGVAAASKAQPAEVPAEPRSLAQILADRRAKLDWWRARGVSGFINGVEVPHTTATVRAIHDAHDAATLDAAIAAGIAPEYRVAGRIVSIRVMGKAAFFHLRDRHGDLQVYFHGRPEDSARLEEVKKLDLGDIVAVSGLPMRTRTGELSLRTHTVTLVTKNLRPLPTAHYGLKDVEARYRHRYEDLAVNPATQAIFKRRAAIVKAIRDFLTARDFLEVETPMMHSLVGGAAARPFITHHNALDRRLYMRIAPELHLKRLLVGGLERVFEINRNFRNEGIDTQHNPEFTMLEFYWAYATYDDLMRLTEEMFAEVARATLGTTRFPYGDATIDFSGPFARYTMREAVEKWGPEFGLDVTRIDESNYIRGFLKHHGVKLRGDEGPGKLLAAIFETVAESQLVQPTFITGFPTEISPLARKNDADPTITDRFELYVAGFEIANAFSELNDPDDQADRFRAQLAAKAAGDDEAADFDADYIRALEIGMPPAAGQGVGIDRLTMLLTNSPSIREVILFPLLREADGESDGPTGHDNQGKSVKPANNT